MKQPVLIRDLFCDRKWYTYVPADNTGTYWHRTDFAIPDPSRPNYFAIAQQMYGIVRPGRSFCYGQSGWIETGTWQSQTLDGWNYRYSNVVGNYIRSQVPDDCNVIQVTVCRAASGDARIGVSWENGETDGLTITSIDVGSIATTGVYIYTVSTCANAQGRALRLKIDGCGAGAARITGVRSFNTRAVGDPSTLYNYSYAGHDLVTVPATAFMHDTGGVYAEAGTIDPSCKIISAPRIGQEFELYWSPASSNSYKYTGGITRFTATDYDYKYHAGEHAAGPGINIDGCGNGYMTDNDECPLGTLLTGAHIVITSTGYVNLNGGGTEHANDPDVTWQYHISAGGVNSYITILFNGNTTIAVLQGLSLSLPEAHSNGSVKMFANSQTVRLDESTSFDSNEIILRLDGVPAEICMEQMGPTAGFTYDAGTRNLNSALTLEALPGSWLPPAGTAWILGNRVKVRSLSAAAKSRICNFARLGNNR